MAGKTEEFTIEGKAARWPDRLDGTKITFTNVADSDAVDDQLAVVRQLLPEDETQAREGLRDFLSVGLRNYILNRLQRWLNSKDDDGRQRSEYVTAEQVQQYVASLQLVPNERRQGVSPKAQLRQAKAQAEKATQERDAFRDAMVRAVLDLPKNKQEARVKEYQEQGLLPADFDLEAARQEQDAA